MELQNTDGSIYKVQKVAQDGLMGLTLDLAGD